MSIIIVVAAVPQTNDIQFVDPGYTEGEVELWGAIVLANEILRTRKTGVAPRGPVPQCEYEEGMLVYPPETPHFHEGTQ